MGELVELIIAESLLRAVTWDDSKWTKLEKLKPFDLMLIKQLRLELVNDQADITS